ncbi:MAG: hypothetical protein SPL21_12415 [Fibrobacter sp.]|nr:hypothetical protein [Fibrobacter sp.]
MADPLDEKYNENGMNLATAPAPKVVADAAAEARKARIKKMRGWLSPRDTVADDFGPEDAALYYGEGHSGWNR